MPTRKSATSWGRSAQRTRETELSFSHGRSTPQIPCAIPPHASPLSSACSDSSQPCSCGTPNPMKMISSSDASRCRNTHTHAPTLGKGSWNQQAIRWQAQRRNPSVQSRRPSMISHQGHQGLTWLTQLKPVTWSLAFWSLAFWSLVSFPGFWLSSLLWPVCWSIDPVPVWPWTLITDLDLPAWLCSVKELNHTCISLSDTSFREMGTIVRIKYSKAENNFYVLLDNFFLQFLFTKLSAILSHLVHLHLLLPQFFSSSWGKKKQKTSNLIQDNHSIIMYIYTIARCFYPKYTAKQVRVAFCQSWAILFLSESLNHWDTGANYKL